jgi:hypothetical protein
LYCGLQIHPNKVQNLIETCVLEPHISIPALECGDKFHSVQRKICDFDDAEEEATVTVQKWSSADGSHDKCNRMVADQFHLTQIGQQQATDKVPQLGTNKQCFRGMK